MVERDTLQALLVRAFGDWTLCRVDADRARDAIAHQPTRTLLTEVGVPVQGPGFALDRSFSAGRPRTLADFVRARPGGDPGWESARTRGHLFVLGPLGDLGSALLDPATGQVLGFESSDAEPFPVNSGLGALLYCLAYVEVHRRVNGVLLDGLESEAGYAAAARIAGHLADIDPRAFADPEENVWRIWIEDGFAIGLFYDWRWERGAVDYFLAHGIDPTTREPYRPLPRGMTAWPGAADGNSWRWASLTRP